MKASEQIIFGVNAMKKSDKRYEELHKLWLDTEQYLSHNYYAPIRKINLAFYKYLLKNRFSNEWDCWSICQKYITGKSYRPNMGFHNFEIVKYADVWGLKRKGCDKLIAIRNTQQEIRGVIKYLIG